MDLNDLTRLPVMLAAIVWLARQVEELIKQRKGGGGTMMSKADVDRILKWVNEAPGAVATITGTMAALARTQESLARAGEKQTEILQSVHTTVELIKERQAWERSGGQR